MKTKNKEISEIEEQEAEEEMKEERPVRNVELQDKKERLQFLTDLMETLKINRFPIDSHIMNEFDQVSLRIKEIELSI